MVSSVTEGEDKPLKYPLMFRACELVVINKIDLLPHVDFDLDRFLYHLDAVHPGVERDAASARAPGEGVDALARLAGRRCRHGAGRRRDAARTGGDRRRRCCARRTAANAVLRGRGRAARAALPPRWPSASPRGGRLIAFGRSPAARSDVRHVAVEFVHPVIVGKRALPALGARAGGRGVALLARPDDIVIAFGDGADGRRGRRRGRARPAA